MNQRHYSKIENQLTQITRERDTLRHDKQQLLEQVGILETKVKQLQMMLHQHPLPYTENARDPMTDQGKISKLHEILKRKNYQVAYLEESNSQLSLQLTQVQNTLQISLNTLEQKQFDLLQSKQLYHSIQRSLESYKSEVTKLNQQLSASYDERLKLIQENTTFSRNIQEERQQHHKKLIELIEQLGPIKEFLKKSESNQNKEAQIDREENKLLSLQQDELEARNEEIRRLRVVCGGNPLPSEEVNLKNTIKHLKGELGRYNNMMRQFVERSITAENTIKQYEEATSRYQKQTQQVSELRAENNSLKDKLQKLQLNYDDLLKKNESEKTLTREIKMTLINTLVENQNYHEMMYESYPENYGYFIQKNRKGYLERMKERQKNEKWVNIQELVQVNELLRRKLKLI